MAAPTRPRAQSHQRASCATAVCCASGRATSSMATGAAHVALQEYIQVSHSTAHLKIHIKPHAYAFGTRVRMHCAHMKLTVTPQVVPDTLSIICLVTLANVNRDAIVL